MSKVTRAKEVAELLSKSLKIEDLNTLRSTSAEFTDIKPEMTILSVNEEAIICITSIEEENDDKTFKLSTGSVVLFRNYDSPRVYNNQVWGLYRDNTYRVLAQEKQDTSRKDFCFSCYSDKLYWQAMAAKCCTCHRVILGG